MNKHVASVHERKKPFKCEICDYSCAQKRSLNIHVAAVHEGNKPFKCDQCSYSSVNKSQSCTKQFMNGRSHMQMANVWERN